MPSVSKTHHSEKHAEIDRSNTIALVSIMIAVFLLVFAVFGVRSLFNQSAYHRRVIREKKGALTQLENNIAALENLQKSYVSFSSEPQNLIAGDPNGTGDRDGNNIKLVLDALPTQYDLPALSSSFEKILKTGGYEINSIGGEESDSLKRIKEAAGFVEATPIPFSFSVSTSQERTKDLLLTLERSIRPMHINQLRMQISSDSITTRITLETFFAQQRTFEVGSKVVK